jgi:hypothetical protein
VLRGPPKKQRTSKFRTGGLPKGRLTTFKAFSDPVSPDRYEGALDQINIWRKRNDLPPLAGKLLEECEREVILAVRSVEKVPPFVVTPKGYRTMLEADALALRKAALGRSVYAFYCEMKPPGVIVASPGTSRASQQENKPSI